MTFGFLDERVKGELTLRYEDVAQDGRLMLEALPASLGVIWRGVTFPKPVRRSMAKAGIIPILTRLVLEAGDGPFGIDAALEVEGGFSMSRGTDEHGTTTRLLLDVTAELHGPKGRTNLPRPEDAGARTFAGRVRAEHVFTRPFAPAGERRVLELDIEGARTVPEAARVWEAPIRSMEGAGDDLELDPTPLVLGVAHTDSNQHVNSLVYPRLFEEAALRRLAALGRKTVVLSRSLDIGYRRPSFAGETLRIALRAREEGPRVVCSGVFFGEDGQDVTKARAYVRMTLA